MASNVLLVSLLVFCLAAFVSARGNIELGLSEDWHLAYHEIHDAYGFPLLKQERSILVRVSKGEVIEAIRVYDLRGDSTSVIEKGGIGYNYAAIGLGSARSKGFRFLIEVYAVPK